MIIEVADLCRSQTIEINSRISLILVEIPVIVFVDAIQIQQVLLNFISNASVRWKIRTEVPILSLSQKLLMMNTLQYLSGIMERVLMSQLKTDFFFNHSLPPGKEVPA